MTRDPLHNLEHINVKPLTDAERARTWLSIKDKLATTPVESPFVLPAFFSSKALAYAFAFVIIAGTVGFSDRAAPGQMLFPVDLAVERVERAITPSSAASHARERVSEFERIAGITPGTDQAAGSALRMQKDAVPESSEADTFTMMAVVADDAAENQAAYGGMYRSDLPEEIRIMVEATRSELLKLEAEATLKGDFETLSQIQASITQFESHVQSL